MMLGIVIARSSREPEAFRLKAECCALQLLIGAVKPWLGLFCAVAVALAFVAALTSCYGFSAWSLVSVVTFVVTQNNRSNTAVL